MLPETGSKAEMGPERICSGEGFSCKAARRRSVWCLAQESRRETVVGEDKLNEAKSKIRGGFFFPPVPPLFFPPRTCAGRIMQDECSDC